jgi:hypothetical protein
MGGNSGMRRQERYGLRALAHFTTGGHFAIGGYGHRGDKAIALAIPRLNEALRPPGVANGLAYGLETVFNRGITDRLSRPYLFAQFLLWNHTVTVRQKIEEHVEHFGSQWDRLTSPA